LPVGDVVGSGEDVAFQVFTEEDGFTITVGANGGCVDWTTTTAGQWRVVVDEYPARGFVRVGFSVRDSYIGDFCWPAHFLDIRDLKAGNNTLTTDPIPVSSVDICGTQYTDTGPRNEQLTFAVMPNMLKTNTVTISVEPVP
jgi:hypothetical protein